MAVIQRLRVERKIGNTNFGLILEMGNDDMRLVRHLTAAGAALLLLGSAFQAQASVIYQAPQNTSGLYSNNQIGFAPCCGLAPGGLSGAYGVGNTVTFAGSGPFNLGTVDLFGYAGGGTLPIEVDLYAGTNPNTGALLGSATVIPTGNGWTTEVLHFGNLLVPQTLTFIVSIVGNNGSWDDSFVDWQQFTGITGAPTIGSSSNMWYGSRGSFVSDIGYAVNTGAQTDTLAVQFNATPLPPTWTMMLVGLAGIALIGYRQSRKTASVSA